MIHQIDNSQSHYNYNAYIYDGKGWPTHFHRNFELIYAANGKNTINVDKSVYEIDTGELVLIPPNAMHSFNAKSGTKLWVGVFSADYIPLFAKNHSEKLYSKFRCDDFIEKYLKKAMFYQGTPDRYILKSALYAVCDQCLKNAAVLTERDYIDTANKILDFISQNFQKQITMQDAAMAFGWEYHYFSSIFHKCFFMNFKELLNLFKFEKACELLEENGKSLSEIAFESGFQSIRTFNTVFKQISGITPTEYIKST